jgi:hypothetical protein
LAAGYAGSVVNVRVPPSTDEDAVTVIAPVGMDARRVVNEADALLPGAIEAKVFEP